MPSVPTIAIVGHCGADSYSLKHLAQKVAPDAQVAVVNDDASLNSHQHAGAIWLVNRVLDGSFPDRSGTDLIRRLKQPQGAAMVLISNYVDAQEQAVAAGAAPGFGKSEIGSPRVVELLRSLLNQKADVAPKSASGD